MFSRLRSLAVALFHRRTFESNMRDEIRRHMELYTADLMSSGVAPEEAARRARLEFGDTNTVTEECRDSRGLHLFDELTRQSKHAIRLLRHAPGFTAASLLTLAVCLGANLSIFAVVDAILLRPLPFPDSSRLVTMYNTYPKAGVLRDGSTITNYYERRGKIPAFASTSIYRYDAVITGSANRPERVDALDISPEFFATLGVSPAQGRAFTESETNFENNAVVILTDRYRTLHFEPSANPLGQQLRVNGRPATVVGVLPRGFRFLSSEAQLYFALASSPQMRAPSERHSGGNSIQMIARLAPGATVAQAQAQIDAQNNSLERDSPQAKMMADAGFRTLVIPLHQDHVATVRSFLTALQYGVLLLLVIGAVNLTNLLLVRAHSRAKEFAVRQALGATRKQLLLEALVETLFIAISGGLLGLATARGGILLLATLGTDHLPLGAHIAFNTRLALAAFVASLVIGLLLALPLAWFSTRQQTQEALKGESRSATAGHATQRLRTLFTAAQIAFSFVLLAGAGLLTATLRNAAAVSPGFAPANVLTGQVTLTGPNYPDPASGLAFSDRVVARLEQQPGVSAAGLIDNVPFSGRSGKSAATVIGHTVRPGESPRGHYSYGVTGDYFPAMGFSLIEGRFLVSADSRRPQRVCVVDSDFAHYYWPHESALGHRLFEGGSYGKPGEEFTVVGVVSSAKQAGLTDESAQGAVYYPYLYRADNHLYIALRSSAETTQLTHILTSTIRSIDPGLILDDVQPMALRISSSLLEQRSPALLASGFAAIALLLTAIGAYGVLSYSVAQRRREIAIRLALGATPARIRTHFLLWSVRILSAGLAVGVAGAVLAGHALQSVLFHVPPFEPTVTVFAALVLAALSFAACLIPATRASRVAPQEAINEA